MSVYDLPIQIFSWQDHASPHRLVFNISLLEQFRLNLIFAIAIAPWSGLLVWLVAKSSREFYRLESKLAVLYEIDLLSRQVAHDIRSPLSALNMVSSSLMEVPEDKRLLIRNATQRINDIANDLLSKGKHREQVVDELGESENTSQCEQDIKVYLLPVLVEGLVSEKRIQFRDQIDVRIDVDLSDSFGAFVKVIDKRINYGISS